MLPGPSILLSATYRLQWGQKFSLIATLHGIKTQNLFSHIPAGKRIDGFFNTIGIDLVYFAA